nr:hypothetical protein [Tanacetum cinerariifolium]
MDQNIDFSGLDQIQSPQYPVNHHISQTDVEEVLQDKEKFTQDTQTFLEKFNHFSFGFTPRVLTIAWERIYKIKYVFTKPEEITELMCKLREDVQNIRDELAEYINSPSWNRPIFFFDDDEEYSIQYREYLEKFPNAVTTVLPTEEPEYSLSMGYEHLRTTPEMKSDEVTESSVKKPRTNPNDDESLPDEDVSIEEFKVYSNPLFDDEEINCDKLDSHCFNAEADLIESLLNRDTLIDFSPKFEADFELEEEIRFVENLLYDNSSPRPSEELNAKIADTIVESLSLSPTPFEDSDSLMDDINLCLATDELLPPNIESDGYDSEGDIYFLEELLVDDSISIPENESFNFDHQNDSLFPRPPPEPPDVEPN